MRDVIDALSKIEFAITYHAVHREMGTVVCARRQDLMEVRLALEIQPDLSRTVKVA